MEFEEFLDSIKDQPSYIIERKLNSLVKKNYNFKNLSSDNKKLVLGLIKKYRPKIKRGIGLSDYLIRKDMYQLYQGRYEHDLTKRDRQQIKAILESLKK
ncbi:MAG: hypothetical protein EOM88_02220 [Clostridia bacterium]|nr:hypothetical protein [Clostridia bacterium]